MDKEIKEFKQKNGSYVKYSVKDLIAGLHTKTDEIGTRVSKIDKNLARVQTTVKFHKKLIYGVIGALAGLLTLMLQINGII